MSILNGYTGGFRIIRGVAGTGKTIILTHFVNNKLEQDDTTKFLILCFNKRLAENLTQTFGSRFQKRNIAVQSLYMLLNRIEFDWQKVGLEEGAPLEQAYRAFETDVALEEFRQKLRRRLEIKPIDYFLCDETQDMPPGFMRIIYEEIQDCIFFIDEAQRFYPFTMKTIAQVFHHPKFEKVAMKGRVRNLYNIYRTPSNIARCAFGVLTNDSSINDYYRRSFYLKKGFSEDVNCILEEGGIHLGDWGDFNSLRALVEELPAQDHTIILTLSRKQAEAIREHIIEPLDRTDTVSAMTYDSVKGLEAQNVILFDLRRYLNYQAEDLDLVYRKMYVILTRAQERLFIATDKSPSDNPVIVRIEEELQNYAEPRHEIIAELASSGAQGEDWQGRLAKLKPIAKTLKESGEYIVTASELFGVIGGLFLV